MEFKSTTEFCFPCILFRTSTCRSTNMECSHRQLSTRFTNTLSSHDANRFSKVDEINKEYDITGKATSAISATTTLSEAAYEKVEELNEKYDFVETSKKAAADAFEKAKNASK